MVCVEWPVLTTESWNGRARPVRDGGTLNEARERADRLNERRCESRSIARSSVRRYGGRGLVESRRGESAQREEQDRLGLGAGYPHHLGIRGHAPVDLAALGRRLKGNKGARPLDGPITAATLSPKSDPRVQHDDGLSATCRRQPEQDETTPRGALASAAVRISTAFGLSSKPPLRHQTALFTVVGAVPTMMCITLCNPLWESKHDASQLASR